MSQVPEVGQSRSQTQMNMDFLQVTTVTIILVKMKAERIHAIFSHSLVLVCNQHRRGMAYNDV